MRKEGNPEPPLAPHSSSFSPGVRVLFVLTRLDVGGLEHQALELTSRLASRGIAPQVVALRGPGALTESFRERGVPVHELGRRRSKWGVGVPVRLARLIRRWQPQVVYTFGCGDALFWGGTLARMVPLRQAPFGFAQGRQGKPGRRTVVAAIHSMRPGMLGRLAARAARRADAVVALAETHAQFLAERYAIPRGKLAVIPNGVDLELFRPDGDGASFDSAQDRSARARLGLPEQGFLVGAVGRLHPLKGMDVLCHAAASVLRHLPTVRFAIIGEGPQRAELEGLVRESRVEARVHFLGRRSDVAELLPAFDLFALPSRSEALPMAVMEAMACGRPVVASAVGCVPELVEHGVTGLCVPADDAERLAEAIVELASDPTRAREMGREGRRRAEERFNIEQAVESTAQLLECAIGRAQHAVPLLPR